MIRHHIQNLKFKTKYYLISPHFAAIIKRKIGHAETRAQSHGTERLQFLKPRLTPTDIYLIEGKIWSLGCCRGQKANTDGCSNN
jgi:hypothetical protein